MGLVESVFNKLSNTRKNVIQVLEKLSRTSKIEDEVLLEIESRLLQTDMGSELAEDIISYIKTIKTEDYGSALFDYLLNRFENFDTERILKKVVLVVGVNGAGKTTSIAKLANHLNVDNDILLVAADTYRAAAVEQLERWSDKINVDIISNPNSKDPASIAFDGVASGLRNNKKHIFIDSAGRLHSSDNLMRELKKIYKVILKQTDQVEVLISIDSTIGQNSLNQIKEFSRYTPIDGVILTKMDGTSKGGIALPIMQKLKVPIYFIGVGEAENDLIKFDLKDYLKSITSSEK
jgi:fused signal recognition particle receptor